IDGRADAEFGFGHEVDHGLREDVGGGVAHAGEAFLFRKRLEVDVFFDGYWHRFAPFGEWVDQPEVSVVVRSRAAPLRVKGGRRHVRTAGRGRAMGLLRGGLTPCCAGRETLPWFHPASPPRRTRGAGS